MKTLKIGLGFNPSLPSGTSPVPAGITFFRTLTPALYSRLAQKCEPSDSPLELGDFRIVGEWVISSKKFKLDDPGAWEGLWGAYGEIFLEGVVPLEKVKALFKHDWQALYWSIGLIYMQTEGATARFTRVGSDVYHVELVAEIGEDFGSLYRLEASF